MSIIKVVMAMLITTSALACPQNVQKVKNGTTVSCDGWLVSEPQMQTFARQDDEVEKLKKLSQQQELLQKLTQEEVEHYKKRSSANEKYIERLETQKFWLAAGAFALGVVVTGVAAKAAIEATR